MAYKITDSCVNCGVCESECPVECIAAGDGKYNIEESECTSCGACVDVCPSDAIVES